jgi:hypothetical protein
MLSAFGVDHGGVSKRQLAIVPTTKKERRKERTKNTVGNAAGTGALSAGLTAALNPKGGRLRPAGQMAVIGSAIGGAFGAAKKPRGSKLAVVPDSAVNKARIPLPKKFKAPGRGRRVKNAATNAAHNVTSRRATRMGTPHHAGGKKMGQRGFPEPEAKNLDDLISQVGDPGRGFRSKMNAYYAGAIPGSVAGAAAMGQREPNKKSRQAYKAEAQRFKQAKQDRKQAVFGKARGFHLITDVGTAAGRAERKRPRWDFDKKVLAASAGGGAALGAGFGALEPGQNRQATKQLRARRRQYEGTTNRIRRNQQKRYGSQTSS